MTVICLICLIWLLRHCPPVFPLCAISTTAAKPAIRCRCGSAIPAEPSPGALRRGLPLHPPSTTAANSAIRCRCGSAIPAEPLLQAFSTALPRRPPSTTAANSAIRCRCGSAFPAEPAPPSSFHNGSKFRDSVPLRCHILDIPARSPAIGSLTFRRCVEASPPPEAHSAAFSHAPYLFHLPKVRRFLAFSAHLPKVGTT